MLTKESKQDLSTPVPAPQQPKGVFLGTRISRARPTDHKLMPPALMTGLPPAG